MFATANVNMYEVHGRVVRFCFYSAYNSQSLNNETCQIVV